MGRKRANVEQLSRDSWLFGAGQRAIQKFNILDSSAREK